MTELSNKLVKTMDNIFYDYINYNKNIEKKENPEMEIRFKPPKISKYDFENVINKLQNIGFKTDNPFGIHLLRISFKQPQNELLNDIRIEIEGKDSITKFCNNEINEVYNKLSVPGEVSNFNFIQKHYLSNKSTNMFDNHDFCFRASFQLEKNINKNDIKSVLLNKFEGYKSLSKFYRYTNRIEYIHPDFPLKCHLNIIKENDNNILDVSFVKHKYNIEIELDNEKTLNMDEKEVLNKLKKTIKYILCGLQETNYPISYSEINSIKREYINLVNIKHKDSPLNTEFLKSTHFIGPSSETLQFINLHNDYEINVSNNYTVTDKADGERKLLFVSSNGKIYLLNTRLEVQYTNCKTNEKVLYNTIIDGEHIWGKDKVNIYAAFDIYYLNGNVDSVKEEKEDKYKGPIGNVYKHELWSKNKKGRYSILLDIMQLIGKTIKEKDTEFTTKNFYFIENKEELYNKCNKLYKEHRQYEIDGLIFTPAHLPVGYYTDKEEKNLELRKRFTWKYSLKWKPANQNTIDFMIISHIKDGKEQYIYENEKKYKILHLYCGNNKTTPIIDLLKGEKSKSYLYDKELFVPSINVVENTYECYLPVDSDNNVFSEMGETINDYDIAEFSFDIDNYNIKKLGFLWKPLRIRYDKIEENFGNNYKNFGNNYDTANNNWKSIHNAITYDMITTGKDVPNDEDIDLINDDDDEVYYNSSTNKREGDLINLRKFHNEVKSKLINDYSKKNNSIENNTLFDIAVGMGGDLHKWIHSKIGFVFGLDISRDNIENSKKGACMRYLSVKKNKPHMVFAVGDSSKLIKNGNASKEIDIKITKENDYKQNKQVKYGDIVDCILNETPKSTICDDYYMLKKYKGIGKNGFDIVSCQFAIHYFFENKEKLENFITNILQTTKKNGYFICTSYDGKVVFDKLKDTNNLTETNNGNILWRLEKNYEHKEFKDDISCIGYPINVYQKSINKYHTEYLVNYDYFEKLMNIYGFQLLKREKFEDIYDDLNNSIKLDETEKNISFLNNYCVFQKTRDHSFEVPIKIKNSLVDYESSQDADVNNKDNITEEVKENYLSKEYVDKIPELAESLINDNILFRFYSSSSDVEPGKGKGEKIPSELSLKNSNKFTALHQIKDWRKHLSNFWIEPFTYDNKKWASSEHYYQASKFKLENPEFYNEFSLDSDSELSKNATYAKFAGGKTGKFEGKLLRPKNIKIDSDFSERDNYEMFIAQYMKFTNNDTKSDYLKNSLLSTHDAKLMHIVLRSNDEFFENLVVIRDILKNKTY